MMENAAKNYYRNYTVPSLLKEGHRSGHWGKYDQPFTFNIAVNDMRDVEEHVPTKYQFIGNTIRDLSAINYMSSSAPDRTVKVAQVRRARG